MEQKDFSIRQILAQRAGQPVHPKILEVRSLKRVERKKMNEEWLRAHSRKTPYDQWEKPSLTPLDFVRKYGSSQKIWHGRVLSEGV
jgi:hypothetical protein